MESDVFKICRLCLSEISDNSQFFCLNSEERNGQLIKKKLMDFVPEVNIYITSTSIICNDCSAAIDFVHKFKKKCLQTENHIRAYISRANHISIPVDLPKFVRQLKEQSEIVDLDSTSELPETTKEAQSEEQNTTVPPHDALESEDINNQEKTEQQNKHQSAHLQFVDIDSVMFNTADSVNYTFEVKENTSKNPVVAKTSSKSKNHRLDDLITRWRKKNYYTCSMCTYRTVFESNLNSHMESHADRIESYNKKLPRKVNIFPTGIFYECYNCGEKKATKHGLVLHMRKHINKQLKCKFKTCSFRAKSKSSLNNHLKTHTLYNESVNQEHIETIAVPTSAATTSENSEKSRGKNKNVKKKEKEVLKETETNEGIVIIETSDSASNDVIVIEDTETVSQKEPLKETNEISIAEDKTSASATKKKCKKTKTHKETKNGAIIEEKELLETNENSHIQVDCVTWI